MFSNRFDEDEIHDNIDAGQLTSWSIIGLTVPDTNIFLDKQIFNMLRKNEQYRYVDCSKL